MSSETIEPVVAPDIPPVSQSAIGRINEAVKTVVYWSIFGVGLVVPPVLGVYGTFF